MPDVHEARCDWCHKRLVGFNRQPVLIEVVIQQPAPLSAENVNSATEYDFRERSLVCQDCLVRLRRFISKRSRQRKPYTWHEALLGV